MDNTKRVEDWNRGVQVGDRVAFRGVPDETITRAWLTHGHPVVRLKAAGTVGLDHVDHSPQLPGRRKSGWMRPITYGRPSQPAYLWRLNLVYFRWLTVKVHRFLNSDPDQCLHDHPWWFFSLILRGGYYELTHDAYGKPRTEWVRPLRLVFRRAEHRHRVLVAEKACGRCAQCSTRRVPRGKRYRPGAHACLSPRRIVPWTLVVTGPVRRRWGFWTKTGWVHHDELEEC